jgi:hypothetical protein
MELIEHYENARRYNTMSLARNVCLLLSLTWSWLMATTPSGRARAP